MRPGERHAHPHDAQVRHPRLQGRPNRDIALAFDNPTGALATALAEVPDPGPASRRMLREHPMVHGRHMPVWTACLIVTSLCAQVVMTLICAGAGAAGIY